MLENTRGAYEIEELVELLEDIGLCLLADDRNDEAGKFLKEELDLRVATLGKEHTKTLATRANLGLAYERQGKWKQAEEQFWQITEIRERVLNAEHPDTLTSMNDLALMYQMQGRFAEAEVLFIRVLETRVKVQGVEHPSMLVSIGNLALTYTNQG
jgi:tetratricopeptide (TPR) repeat protein